jgi:uncharacterized protein
MVIADTGYLFALMDVRDGFHARAKQVTESLREDLITTWPVIAETAYMLNKFVHLEAQFAFLDTVSREELVLFEMAPAKCARAVDLMRKYASLPMDVADASLVVLAEHLGHGRILSTDQRDFGAYRWKNTKPFQNLLLP